MANTDPNDDAAIGGLVIQNDDDNNSNFVKKSKVAFVADTLGHGQVTDTEFRRGTTANHNEVYSNGNQMYGVGRKQFSNLQDDPVTANVEWKHPPYDTDTENAAVYIKLTHRAFNQDDFIYGIYGEIENQSITGGSLTKCMHFGRGDAHYVALFYDQAVQGNSGGYGYEAAMFADGETGFLASFQGTSGFDNSNSNQANCQGFVALVHDDATDPTLQSMTAHNFGLFNAVNSLGNSFVVRQSEYIPNAGTAQIKVADHNYRPLHVIFGTGEMHQYGLEADASNQNRAAPEFRQRNYYWDGSDEQIYDVVFSPSISGAPTPTPQLTIAFQEIVDNVPQSVENMMVMDTTNGISFQNYPAIGVDGITMKDSGAHLDMQGAQVINTGAVTPLAAGSIIFGKHHNLIHTSTPTGTTQTIDWLSGNTHYIDLGSASGNVTLTLNNATQGGTYEIRAHNNGSNRNIVWPAAVTWPGGTAPTITTGAAAEDFIVLHFDGTNYMARAYQAFS